MIQPPFETFTRPTCRGCYALNTACGRCERCAWERAKQQEEIANEKVKTVVIPQNVLLGIFEGVPANSTLEGIRVNEDRETVSLFIKSSEFPKEQPWELPLRLRVVQWTSETLRRSDNDYTVNITQGDKKSTAHFYGEAAVEQAEIYHIAQRQKAGLL